MAIRFEAKDGEQVYMFRVGDGPSGVLDSDKTVRNLTGCDGRTERGTICGKELPTPARIRLRRAFP